MEREYRLEIIANTTDICLKAETAAAIGKFDGIHIGHRRLLEEILSRKRDGLAACVFTFDPPPTRFFGGSDDIGELTTREEKRLLFEMMGVDILIEFPLNEETAATPPESFARDILAGQMNARFVAAGTDLSFGAKGAGNAELLRKMSPELGFGFKTIEKVCLNGEEVSSTLVREKVEKGEMEEACRLLGMPYLIAGEVVSGNHIGRKIGFPTINILPEKNKLLPPNGVYFSTVSTGGKNYRAITNVGYKPTVADGKVMGVESYLYDFDGDIYGQQAEVYLHSFHRPERKFESVEALRRQLEVDITVGAGV
ncbi:MAG TPA: bifunctional riboflavin kinase/FMN adenylyltransferase [Lachnospiraceae bacterium]|nr:bifunctional riboflavin kinase/FMN adenylyltransferase [Lachnospiraceae bacterium]